jgi:hypothetical protein
VELSSHDFLANLAVRHHPVFRSVCEVDARNLNLRASTDQASVWFNLLDHRLLVVVILDLRVPEVINMISLNDCLHRNMPSSVISDFLVNCLVD